MQYNAQGDFLCNSEFQNQILVDDINEALKIISHVNSFYLYSLKH